MSADDNDHDDLEDTGDVRERIEQEADRAVEQFDEGIVDLLAWVLDTETRARIYVHLRQHPESTSEEIAEGTGLYPSTVREALAALTEEEVVTRQKRESDGAGNNPYEYSAIPPSDLVNTIVGDIQSELNTVFNLDDHIGGGETTLEPDDEPVTISVEDANDGTNDADASEDTGDEGNGSEGGDDDADV
ncbi:transcriptional regulator [Haloarcula hispanica N601]|uniref:Transcriptional regulator n=2 Tax=Haloarcula hispanica TaxID=51589 RepID=V5TKN5_HALHI|nr:winged helix-turn-helix domain-containing protein [Haloarcula hispanica]AEM57114.1 transcription regulator [Haloarcula hispanica ATCC 33960]AHB65901.1 transcriptional regulator [Haloarcula hispanica N601]